MPRRWPSGPRACRPQRAFAERGRGPEDARRLQERREADLRPRSAKRGQVGVLNGLYNAMRAKGYETKDPSSFRASAVRAACRSSSRATVSTASTVGPCRSRRQHQDRQPDLKVLAMGGDGDAFARGGGHFIHAARRNLDICYVIMDNNIYGLTKGRPRRRATSASSPRQLPGTRPDRPINPLLLAVAGATFVARAFSGKPKELRT